MDPALIRQRQEFMKNAIKSMGIVSKPSTSQPQSSIDQQRAKKRKKESTNRTTESKAKSDGIGVLSGPGEQNASNFSLMSKIVDYMKKRHLDLHYWPLSLQECIDEMNIGIVPKRTMTWLEDTIKNNHRLQVKDDGKFEYKPPHRVKNQKMLLDLFKRRHFESEGATLLSDLNDSVSNAELLIKRLGNQVIDIPTQVNKRKDHAYFYNATADAEDFPTIDEELVKLWRLSSVEHLDEKKVEEYLQKHGISTAKDLTPKRLVAAVVRRKERKRANVKVHNVHIEGILEDYNFE